MSEKVSQEARQRKLYLHCKFSTRKVKKLANMLVDVRQTASSELHKHLLQSEAPNINTLSINSKHEKPQVAIRAPEIQITQ